MSKLIEETSVGEKRRAEHAIKEKGDELMTLIFKNTPVCQRSNNAKARLEESIMWAVKSIYAPSLPTD